MLFIEDLHYRYPCGASTVFHDLAMTVRPGEVVGLVGPSGCGKSTLLNLVAGLARPLGGTLQLCSGCGLGYIFQRDALLPWRTVEQNIRLAAELDEGRRTMLGKVPHCLELFGLHEACLQRYPAQLSTGQRQRVAIIQALMADPGLFLLDEPFAALDFYTKLRLEGEFRRLIQEEGKAALLVTHDVDEALAMSDRIYLMGMPPAGVVAEFRFGFAGQYDPETVRGLPGFAAAYRELWGELKGRMADAHAV